MILPKRVQTDDQLSNRTQDATSEAFRLLQSQNPVLESQTLQVSLSATPLQIAHRLGRVPVGYLVVDRDADRNVWTSAAATDRFLTLVSSGSVTVKLFIF